MGMTMLRWSTPLAIVVLLTSFASAAPSKKVVVLHEGSNFLPYQFTASEELKKAFSSARGVHIEIFEEYLDKWRLGADLPRLAIALDTKYAGQKIDVVVADGVTAFQLLVNYTPQFLRAVPVVFFSMSDLYLPQSIPPNVTGVATHIDYAGTARLAVTLQPGLKHLYYVVSEPLERAESQMLDREFGSLQDKLDVVIWDRLGLADLLKKVSTLPPDSAVLYDSYFRDSEGRTYIPAEVCSLLSVSSNAPVYVLYRTMIGKGAVGGVVVNFVALSQRAAEMAVALLQGANISDFPVERSRNETLIDWKQFERFHLAENKIPASATVWFRPPAIWQQYGAYLVLGGLVVLLQLFLIFRLAMEGRRRKRSEASTRKLAGWLIRAQEEERRRIARELHDDLSQRLSLMCMQVDTLRSSLPCAEDALVQGLTRLYDQADTISSEVHQLSHELHSAVLDKLGLLPALRRYCEEFSLHRGVAVELGVIGEEFPLNREVALALFRVAQECLTNVAKHSAAASAELRLSFRRDSILLEIEDKGRGFGQKELEQKAGLGIESMRERLRSVNGTLRINSSPAHGTTIRAEAPAAPLSEDQSDHDLPIHGRESRGQAA
jgi:signal transduction histidine kinase